MSDEPAVPIYRTWRAIEVGLLVLCLADASIEQQINFTAAYAVNIPVAFGLVVVALMLNALQPFKLSAPMRLMIPVCEIIVTASFLVLGGVRFIGVLLPVIVAKAFTFLERKMGFAVIVVAILAQLASLWARYHGVSHLQNLVDLTGIHLPLFILSRSGGICAAILFSAWMSVSLMQERETRLRAEQLSEQLEVFAKKIERTRVARDIHDTLGHTLTSLNLQLDIARMPGQNVPLEVLKTIDIAKQLAEQSFEDLKSAIHMLRGSEFDLKAALEALIFRFTTQSQMAIKLDDKSPPLTPRVASDLYYLVLEVITNAQKHAGASELSISLQDNNGRVVVSAQDNGKGFDPAASASGFGLKGMRERVAAMGGELQIESSPGRGTLIRATIPVGAAAQTEREASAL